MTTTEMTAEANGSMRNGVDTATLFGVFKLGRGRYATRLRCVTSVEMGRLRGRGEDGRGIVT